MTAAIDTYADGRRGDWFQTFTGRRVWPLDPRAGDYVIEDIAHHLALEARFNGATRFHYSVAQHSVLGSYLVEPALARRFLLHDAAEAFVKDIPRPLKIALHEYKPIEKAISAVINSDFGLEGPESAEIKIADLRMLVTERRDLCHWPPPAAWAIDKPEAAHPPAPFTIERWSPEKAEREFLARFDELWPGLRGVAPAAGPARLTDRQLEILVFIAAEIDERGYPPTIREIGVRFGIRSTNSVNDHLKALERKGYVTSEQYRTRTLRLTVAGTGAIERGAAKRGR